MPRDDCRPSVCPECSNAVSDARGWRVGVCVNCYRRRLRREGRLTEKNARIGGRAEQKRRYDTEARRPCVDCGERLVWAQSERCRACADIALRARYPAIQEMWARGASLKEIAESLGSTKGSVSVTITRMRQAGWDVPYRYARSASRV